MKKKLFISILMSISVFQFSCEYIRQSKEKPSALSRLMVSYPPKPRDPGLYISGTILDSTGKAIPNATVQILGRGESSVSILPPASVRTIGRPALPPPSTNPNCFTTLSAVLSDKVGWGSTATSCPSSATAAAYTTQGQLTSVSFNGTPGGCILGFNNTTGAVNSTVSNSAPNCSAPTGAGGLVGSNGVGACNFFGSTNSIPNGYYFDNSQGASATAIDGSACPGTNFDRTATNNGNATGCPATFIAPHSELSAANLSSGNLSKGAQYVLQTCGRTVVDAVNSFGTTAPLSTNPDSFTGFGQNVRVYCDTSTLSSAATSVGISNTVVPRNTVVASFTTDATGSFNGIKFTVPNVGNTYDIKVTTSAGRVLKTRRLKINNNGVSNVLQPVTEAISRALLESSTGKDITSTESSWSNIAASQVDGTSSPSSVPSGSYDFIPTNISIEIAVPRNYIGILSGTITSDVVWTRTDGQYYLNGTVIVPSGRTITIGPGVTVIGSASPGGALLIKPGGKIFVNGTANAPVVFTSEKSAGSRAPADWQGIIIQGNGVQTFGGAGSSAIGEGDVGNYGGSNNSDSSGSINYLRVEFAGAPFSPGNERNCISLMAVGSGTSLNYVQCHRGFDDGFEQWGGAFNARYLISTGNRDDQFDFADGFIGTYQFAIGQIYASTAPTNDDITRCIEGDGNSALSCTSSARNGGDCSDPYFANVTCVGAGGSTGGNGALGGPVTNHGDAIFVRRATPTFQLGDYTNILVDNYGNNKAVGCRTDSRTVDARITNLFYTRSATSDCPTPVTNLATPSAGISTQVVTTISETSPDFTPLATSTPTISATDTITVTNFTNTSGASGFRSAAYYGAVRDANDTWWKGWTSFSQN